MTWADLVTGELRKCTDCGLCLAACPTFAASRAEGDSPRGRIHLLTPLLAGSTTPTGTPQAAVPADSVASAHLASCIECAACHAPCPTGVRFASARRKHRLATHSLDRPAFEERVAELADTVARDPGAELTVRTVRALLSDAEPEPDHCGPRDGGVLVLAGTMLRLAAPAVVDRLDAGLDKRLRTLVRDPQLATALDRASGLFLDVGLSTEHDRALARVGELAAARRYERLTVAAFDLLSLRLAEEVLPSPLRVVPAHSVLPLTFPIPSDDLPDEYRTADAPVLLSVGALTAVRELVDAKRTWLRGRPWVTRDSRDLVRFPNSRHLADLIASEATSDRT